MLKEYKVKIEFDVATYGGIDGCEIAQSVNKKVYDVLKQWTKDSVFPITASFTTTEVESVGKTN
jgi:hypothetical protein